MRKYLVLMMMFVSFSVLAEPSGTVTYLMTEPVTLFDKGIGELRAGVFKSLRDDEFPELLYNLITQVDYDWDANRITIDGGAHQRSDTRKNVDPKKLCERIVNRVKQNLGYDGNSKVLVDFGISGLARYFTHVGFKSKKEPDSLERDLASITVIKVSIYSSKNDKSPFDKELTCFSELSKKDIFYN